MYSVRRLATIALQPKTAGPKHALPELPYAYEALEPIISRDIMHIHHTKHHQAYVTNLNAAEEKLRSAVENGDANTAVSLTSALKFNGGGHLNHSIFWKNLTPSATEASPVLCQGVNESFGSFDKLKEQLSALSVCIQGSGWGWLAFDPTTKNLTIRACANQDPLQATTGLIPLLGIDVWEHAYYLQYKNARADYVKAIFDVINWEYVSDKYAELTC